MRILIDLQCCQSGSRVGGIGRYSMSLAKAMLRLRSEHRIELLLNSSLPDENFVRAEFAELLSQQDIHSFSVPPFVAADNGFPAHTRIAELMREKRIAEIGPDVLHIASLFEGAGENVVTSVGRLFPAARTAVTLYDLIPYREQETYLGTALMADHYLGKFEQLQSAGALLSISEYSRQEALEHTAIPAERITNISSAVDKQFAPSPVAEPFRSALLLQCGIDRPFVMFTGSFDVRKNHVRLVKAFAKVQPSLAQQCQLVIVGKGLPRQVARLQAIARFHGLDPTDIVFVGHISDVELVALYNLCTLFVFPSLREGFGLPVLEAMSCGAATIGSDGTSVPEVIGREDALFDARSVDDIAAKMGAVLRDETLHADLRRHGMQQAKNFSWDISARRALDTLERLHEHAGPILPSEPSEATAYGPFLAALEIAQLGRVSGDFLASAARAIAADELRLRLGAPDFSLRMKSACIAPAGQDCCGSLRVTSISSAWHWTLTGPDSLAALDRRLANESIEILLIEACELVLGLPLLAELIVQQKALGRHVFVTLASVDAFGEVQGGAVLDIRAAFKSCDGILVHSVQDLRRLENFKLRKNLSWMPSGAICSAGRLSGDLLRKVAFTLSAAA